MEQHDVMKAADPDIPRAGEPLTVAASHRSLSTTAEEAFRDAK
ncbi:hypothetical protein [Pseudonocardia sp. HH130630-07]|nr:hypothetical protein [Pseudonocardia sp. HH130630-07]